MIAASKGARRTAALKFVEDEIGLPELVKASWDETVHFETAVNDKRDAAQSHLDATKEMERYVQERTLVLSGEYRETAEKQSDAGLKRHIDEGLNADVKYVQLADAVYMAKRDLIEAEAKYEIQRAAHRLGISTINAIGEQLGYLRASKEASIAAVQQLSGL